jgi:hypothetical protein
LKKTLPDLPHVLRHHLDDLMKYLTGDCPVLRWSTSMRCLQEKGKMALLLEMLVSKLLLATAPATEE